MATADSFLKPSLSNQAGGQIDVIAYPAAVKGVLTRILQAGHGKPIIFLHGVGARADRWRRNFNIAIEGYRCFALDLPGHGLAQKGPDFPYGVRGYADFVEGFLDDQKIDKVTLVGTSLGAHIAATVACRAPRRLSSLVLVGATGMFPLTPEIASGIADRLKDLTREGIERKLKNVVFDPNMLTDSWIQEEYAINNSPGARETFERLSEYFRHHINSDVVGDQLSKIVDQVPTTLIWGEQDRSVPLAVGQRTKELLNGVPLHVMAACAHVPYLEAPELFRRHLSEALKRIH